MRKRVYVCLLLLVVVACAVLWAARGHREPLVESQTSYMMAEPGQLLVPDDPFMVTIDGGDAYIEPTMDIDDDVPYALPGSYRWVFIWDLGGLE